MPSVLADKARKGSFMKLSVRNKAISLGIVFMLIFTSCARPAPKPTSDEIIDTVISNFELLAKIPRPSHHEKAVSDFFVSWAKEQGLDPVQDSHNNVMFNVPATKGYENKPLVILQDHMDMVVAVEDGKDFDPLKDTVTLIRDDQARTITADGTSLGADNGIGCGIMMSVVQGKMPHGPLRVIITTDEEDGMDGMFNLDPSWLDGAKYLINIDNEESDNVTVSTAAGDSLRITGTPEFSDAKGDKALAITVSGLAGGHSGVDIDKGRLNGIRALAGLLKELSSNGISYELANIDGGSAPNAIPERAKSVIVIDSKDQAQIESIAAGYLKNLQESYLGIEDSIEITITGEDTIPQVVSEEFKNNVIRLTTEIIDGIYTMSKDMEGLVESSSNIGILRLDPDGLYATTYIRSSVGSLETEILNSQLDLVRECGFSTESIKMSDPWPYNPDSELTELTKKIYLEQNGEEIKIVAVHAGLECGTLALLSPDLDMICIGADIRDAHTTRETVMLDSIPVCWNLLAELLVRI